MPHWWSISRKITRGGNPIEKRNLWDVRRICVSNFWAFVKREASMPKRDRARRRTTQPPWTRQMEVRNEEGQTKYRSSGSVLTIVNRERERRRARIERFLLVKIGCQFQWDSHHALGTPATNPKREDAFEKIHTEGLSSSTGFSAETRHFGLEDMTLYWPYCITKTSIFHTVGIPGKNGWNFLHGIFVKASRWENTFRCTVANENASMCLFLPFLVGRTT